MKKKIIIEGRSNHDVEVIFRCLCAVSDKVTWYTVLSLWRWYKGQFAWSTQSPLCTAVVWTKLSIVREQKCDW